MRKKNIVLALLISASLLLTMGCNPKGSDDDGKGSYNNRGSSYTSANIGILKYVPAGRFQRDRTVTNISVITQPFRMSQHEITRAQFMAIMGVDPSDTNYSSGLNDPVQMVNWYHAIAFCNKLSLAEGLTPVYSISVNGTPVDWELLSFSDIPTEKDDHQFEDWDGVTANWFANGYRLPTEMEWMWAAMGAPADGQGGGTNTTGYTKDFAGDNGSNAIGDYAVWDYSDGPDAKTSPVGNKLPNELGLYDMSGNVVEWTWDWHEWDTGTLTDYRGVASGTHRVYRGGGWNHYLFVFSVDVRGYGDPYDQFQSSGFRVVRQ